MATKISVLQDDSATLQPLAYRYLVYFSIIHRCSISSSDTGASHVCNWKAIFAINSSVIVDIAWVYVFVSHTYLTVVRADDAEGLYLMDLQHCECDTFTAYKNLG